MSTSRARRTTGPRPRGRAPRLVVEAGLVDEGYLAVAGVDEVGRGCLAGPVTVGVVVVDPAAGMPPRGLRDSKLLTAEQRRRLVPRIERWVLACSVASATAAEIDTYGIIAALRLAAHRALAELPAVPDCVLLDGNHDYLTPRPAQVPTDQLALEVEVAPVRPTPVPVPLERHPVVRTRIKADLTCASVAAASVLAKASRDAFMVGLAGEHPDYGWEVNKGYATPYHRAALRRHRPLAVPPGQLAAGAGRPRRPAGLDELAELADGADLEELAALADAVDAARPRRDGVGCAGGPDGRARWGRAAGRGGAAVSAEDLERYETDMELQLYREYRDVVGLFSYVVETERRFYLTNKVDLQVRTADGEVYFEVTMSDAWVWDMYRPGAVRQERQGAHVQGRERRGARRSPTCRCRRTDARGVPQTRDARGASSTAAVLRVGPARGRRDEGAHRRWCACGPRTGSGGTARTWRPGTWSSRGSSCSTATGAASSVRSTSSRATATSWWSAR